MRNGNGSPYASGNGASAGDGGRPGTGRTLAVLRRHGAALIRQQFGGRPRILELEVTGGCDARCAWCEKWRAPGSEPELTDYAALVRRIQPLDLAVVGGEPLVRPDLDRIIASLRLTTEVSSISVLTNGIALEPYRARRLLDAGTDKLILLVEGLGEENDRARRHPGLADHIDRLIPQLVEMGFRTVQLQFAINGRNGDQLVEAAYYARERRVRLSYSLDGPGRLEARRFPLDDDTLNRLAAALEKVADLAERWPHIVSSPEYLRGVVPHLRHEGGLPSACGSGTAFLRATPDGWIRPCAWQPPLGHWTAFPFPPRSLDCAGCWSRLRGETQEIIGVSRLVELYRASGSGPASPR